MDHSQQPPDYPDPSGGPASPAKTGARVASGFLLSFSILALGFLYLLSYFVQRQAAFFSDFSGGEAQMPAFTRRAIWLADWLEANWYLVLPVWLALAVLTSLKLKRFAVPLAILLALLMVALLICAVFAMQIPVMNLVNVIK